MHFVLCNSVISIGILHANTLRNTRCLWTISGTDEANNSKTISTKQGRQEPSLAIYQAGSASVVGNDFTSTAR